MTTEKTDLNKEIQYLSECSICTDVFIDPRILPCIHTFCLKCIQLTGEQKNIRPGEKMSCPICREEFIIPQLGWSSLKKNFFMQRLVEVSKSLTQTDNRILCDVCQSNGQSSPNAEIPSASVYCADCEDNLCEQCHGEHKRHKLSKSHKIEIECRIKHKQYKCDEHQMETMTEYCATCKKIICHTCSVEGHSAHNWSDVEKTAAIFGRKIESYIKNADVFIEELTGKRDNLEQEKELFHNCIKAREIETAKATDNDRKTIMEEISAIKHSVEKQHAIESDEIQSNLLILDTFRRYCSKIILEGLPCEICSSFDEICSQAEVLQQKMRPENSKTCQGTTKGTRSQSG